MIKRLVILVIVFASLSPVQALNPVQQVEQQIVKADHEIVVIFDAGGREIARFEGGATRTTVRITYRWRNGTLTHNHPGLPSLSPADLNTCAKGDVRECRAVSVSMGRFVVCRAWKVGRWPYFNVKLLESQIHTLIDYRAFVEKEQLVRGYYAGLSRQLGFGYTCEGV